MCVVYTIKYQQFLWKNESHRLYLYQTIQLHRNKHRKIRQLKHAKHKHGWFCLGTSNVLHTYVTLTIHHSHYQQTGIVSNWHSSYTIATLDLRPRKLKAQGKEESSKWEDWEPKIATGEITRPCAVQVSPTLKNVYQKFSNLEVLNQLKSYFNITKTHSYINVVLVTEPWPSTGLTSCFFWEVYLLTSETGVTQNVDVRNFCFGYLK